MLIRRGAACGVILGLIGLSVLAAPATPPAPKPKVTVTLDSPENTLKTYFSAWKETDYHGIMACIKTTNPARESWVVQYVTYMMWLDQVGRACVDKFGEDEGLRAVSHVRTLPKQYELDLKRILNANFEYEAERTRAWAHFRVERDRPAGLITNELFFRDDYALIKDGKDWKIDFLRTYKLEPADKEAEDAILYNVNKLYPALSKRLKELCADVKSGKIKSADEVKTAIGAEEEKER